MIESALHITVSDRVPLSAAGREKPTGQASFEAFLRAASGANPAPSQPADDASTAAKLGRGRVGSDREGTITPPPGDTPPLSPDELLGFFRSDDREGPVRFKQVPDWAKWPVGNFRQAPEELGGEWWRVTPFTDSEPWTSLNRPFERPVEILPEGFEALFGTRPVSKDYAHYMDFKVAELRWESDLEGFKGIGLPEGINMEALAAATEVMVDWGLGEPQFYQNSYGWHAKFPDSANPRFEINPATLLMAPQLTVSRYQFGLIELGIAPERVHPLVPPFVLDRLQAPALT